MDLTVPGAAASELAPAFLLLAVTLGLSWVFAALFGRHRKPYFAWWATAWVLYALRLAAIGAFIVTEHAAWLYWHQVATGWTALVLLWAALVFSQDRRWRSGYAALLLFPPLWSWVAIYRLEGFLSAAGPAVVFLSVATLLTAWAFFRHYRQVGSASARFLAFTFLLWGFHHLDYPFLRARGVWNPWGYYLDALFALAVGGGILLLVQEDLLRGLGALSRLSAALQGNRDLGEADDRLLQPALSLPGVRGTALAIGSSADGFRCVNATGTCAPWAGGAPPAPLRPGLERAMSEREPRVIRTEAKGWDREAPAYVAVLPVLVREEPRGAVLVVGDARDPFAALDPSVLVALGQQVGAALERTELSVKLGERTADLERLAERMVHHQEEERRHLSRELHDETAQLFAAVSLQLGAIAEAADPEIRERIVAARGLVAEGIQSIRGVTDRLRPTLLDDLGLLPAVKALTDGFRDRSGIPVTVALPESLPALTEASELAIYRALQEGLANVARHADASAVHVELGLDGGAVVLAVEDDGRGLKAAGANHREGPGEPTGLAGLRERIAGLGGSFSVHSEEAGGTRLVARIPCSGREGSARVPSGVDPA